MMKTKTTMCRPFETAQIYSVDGNAPDPAPRLESAIKSDADRLIQNECRAVCVINAITQAIGGQVLKRSKIEPGASPGFYLPRADFLLLGTGLTRPSVLEEAKELANLTGDSIAVVRVAQDDQADRPFTVDILMAHSEHWACRYIPWQIHNSSELWFVPSHGEGRSFRVLPAGLLMSPRAPFSSLYEREYGFGLAMRSITNMMGAR